MESETLREDKNGKRDTKRRSNNGKRDTKNGKWHTKRRYAWKARH